MLGLHLVTIRLHCLHGLQREVQVDEGTGKGHIDVSYCSPRSIACQSVQSEAYNRYQRLLVL